MSKSLIGTMIVASAMTLGGYTANASDLVINESYVSTDAVSAMATPVAMTKTMIEQVKTIEKLYQDPFDELSAILEELKEEVGDFYVQSQDKWGANFTVKVNRKVLEILAPKVGETGLVDPKQMELLDIFEQIEIKLSKWGPGPTDYLLSVKAYTKGAKMLDLPGDMTGGLLRKVSFPPVTAYTIKVLKGFKEIRIGADTWRSAHAIRFELPKAIGFSVLKFNRFWVNELRLKEKDQTPGGFPIVGVRVNIGWNGNFVTVNGNGEINTENRTFKAQGVDVASLIKDNLPKLLFFPFLLGAIL